jgi:hypothetical protein
LRAISNSGKFSVIGLNSLVSIPGSCDARTQGSPHLLLQKSGSPHPSPVAVDKRIVTHPVTSMAHGNEATGNTTSGYGSGARSRTPIP